MQSIQEKLPHIQFVSDKEQLASYAHDHTEDLEFVPKIVALPSCTKEVSELVDHCFKNNISIFPRGAGTGLVAGSLAVQNGIMISLERMNVIEHIDTENGTATVQAGVINYELQKALEPFQLFYPPDPSSWQSSFIGGNIATNAGGPKAVKYGVTSNWVLNLEVVLANGDVIWTGANTLKNVTAYNLTQLFIGSEGTLGIITKAVLRLMSRPPFDNSMLVSFHRIQECAEAVSFLFKNNLQASSLEFMERRALLQMQKLRPEDVMGLNEKTQAQLLISFDGNDKEEIMQSIEKTYELLQKFEIDEPIVATSDNEKERIWRCRRTLSEVVKSNGFTIEEDTVVPRNQLPKLVDFTHELANKHNVEIVCYGHAGDGNLHIRIKHPKYKHSYNNPEVEEIITELFIKVKELGGTLSAEHGIGLIQKKYLSIFLSQSNLKIQKEIKKALDPKNIMNPSKIF